MKVFFSDQMVADSKSFSPSAGKPALAVQSWLAKGLPVDIVAPQPATVEQLCRAHREKYVRGVLSGRIANGFSNRSKVVAASLPYTTGAMIDAARYALQTGLNACAPVSGFHHAGYDSGGGFCTFNGLMVAALDLLATGEARRVGILDCDQHFGDGTHDIIERLGVAEEVVHFTAGGIMKDADEFIDALPELINSLFADCDVLLYQAGADPHVDDPLGGWMTTAQLLARDEAVFATAKRLCLPVAWNLAGGYQRDKFGGIGPVLEIHDNTMRACIELS